MLTPMRRDTLQKTYALVGSHSAVKLCRWQKSMMRGRGGCYKWSFYGIQSHRCMEATPSMGCANKCTFCWRLGANPTVKDWNFQTDPPVALVDEMIRSHQALVQNARGIPGATETGVSEALEPKHCALSLVGEPIVYPRINEFTDELHRRGISTFLVNNGQFPEAIRDLRPITQLYLSVDAATKEDMKKLDRPIFADFWERFNASVDFMAAKSGRTTFRLTLIGDNNMGAEDLPRYADIIRRGRPDFVELKQVTPAFQGHKASPFRMSNVPAWDSVTAYATKLAEAIGAVDGMRPSDPFTEPSAAAVGAAVDAFARPSAYGVAVAHEHSKCVLLARRDRFQTGPASWRTWIDYGKFNELIGPYTPAPALSSGPGEAGASVPESAGNAPSDSVPDGKDAMAATPSVGGRAKKGKQYAKKATKPGTIPEGLSTSAADAFAVARETNAAALAMTAGLAPITPLDYACETPPWAVFGAREEGFDPAQTRHRTNKYHRHVEREAAEAKAAAEA